MEEKPFSEAEYFLVLAEKFNRVDGEEEQEKIARDGVKIFARKIIGIRYNVGFPRHMSVEKSLERMVKKGLAETNEEAKVILENLATSRNFLLYPDSNPQGFFMVYSTERGYAFGVDFK